MARRINHIAIAVRETAAALHFYADTLGLEAHPTRRVDSEGVDVTFLDVGGARIEILEPLAPDSPVGRFLDKRGEGLHHICLEVDDLRATCAELAARGYNVIDQTPRRGAGGEQLAFIHPGSTNGVLIELYQAPEMPTGPRGEEAGAAAHRSPGENA